MNHQTAWAMLDAYLDGALGASDRWRVSAHLDECAICRKRVAQQARLRGAVRDHLAAVAPPAGLSARLHDALAEDAPSGARAAPPWRTPIVLRLVALAAPAVAALWLLIRVTAPVTGSAAVLHVDLALAHTLFAHDESMLDVTGEASRIEMWFREEADLAVPTPELDGYELVGGRLIALNGRPAAQLVYEADREERYLSLIRFANPAPTLNGYLHGGVSTDQAGAVALVTWPIGENRTALVAAVPEGELRELGEDLATGTDPGSPVE
jgi:anti-sigma factor RsiW